MNPIEMLKGIMNPKQFVMNFFKNNSNPILSNMINLAEQGRNEELESIVRNALKEKGIDYDKEKNTVYQMLRK